MKRKKKQVRLDALAFAIPHNEKFRLLGDVGALRREFRFWLDRREFSRFKPELYGLLFDISESLIAKYRLPSKAINIYD